MKPRLLIVDDEELIRWTLCDELSASGYHAFAAEAVPEALALVEKETPDIILTDLRLGNSSGMEILREVRKSHPETPVVLMTAFAEVASAVEALREGAADYILKPMQLDALKIALRRVLDTYAIKRRMAEGQRKRRSRYNFQEVVAQSASMRRVVEDARKMAANEAATVLLLGESGCGKDLLARAIHYESARSEAPFMEISCTAIPESLMESELFGHEKGSFTGATAQKKGLFELAAGGTVFLNEIGHMPLGLQAKLLRVLEDKTFLRVGGVEELTVNVRIMAATNEDLARAIAQKTFRADLFYRLNVLSLQLQPLRRRPEDILPLAEKLLERLCRDMRKPKPEIGAELKRSLEEYPWPGNVRELRNVLERMLILGDIKLPMLPGAGPGAQGAPEPARGGEEGGDSPGKESPPAAPQALRGPPVALPEEGVDLDVVEKELVRQAIERSGGNQQKAAMMLRLSKDAFRRRLEKFGLKAFLLLFLWGPARGGGKEGARSAEAAKEDPFLAEHRKKAEELRGLPVVHAPVRSGECSACHASPKAPSRLKGEGKELCLSCHKERRADLGKPTTHFPFKEGECTACHSPHSSTEPALLVEKQAALCSSCHALAEEAALKAHQGVSAFQGACTVCHDPHASSEAKLAREKGRHAPFAGGSCESCHEKPSDGKAKVKEPLGPSCLECHSEVEEAVRGASAHPPFKAGACAKCHQPHASPQQALLRSKPDDLCRSCHAGVPRIGHPSAAHPTCKEASASAKGLDCSSCHAPHGSKWPKLTRKGSEELCQGCHQQ